MPLLVEIFNRMLRSIDYEGEPICKESTFTLILKMYLHDLLAIEATVNRHESLGRPDFAFNYENFSTSYSYTKIGYIENTSGLKDSLGRGSVEISFSVNK